MSSFSHSPSESPHPPEMEKSFSEVVLDSSSRTRDALPEQYRAYFDELRQSILAFCDEFGIPKEALRNKETFGVELASKKIPQERMQEAVSLFARLEYLVTNKEPLKEKEEPLEYAERLYHLREQYGSQIELLEQVGILKDGVIKGIDGEDYPVPTLEQIAQRLYERRELLETKQDQGFTKLLLVPFGMSLDALRETLKQFLLVYKQTHPDFNIDTSRPVYALEEYKGADTGNPPKFIYNPKSFHTSRHRGKTKAHILKEQADNSDFFSGWTVHFFQPSDPTNQESKGFAPIPKEGQGQIYGVKIPRHDLEANKTPKAYLSILQKAQDNPAFPYCGESGMAPEDWILAFITHLAETGEPLDVHGIDVAFLIRGFFVSSLEVPRTCFNRGARGVFLDKFDSNAWGGGHGVRTSVII